MQETWLRWADRGPGGGARPARLPGPDRHPPGAQPAAHAGPAARGLRRRVAARAAADQPRRGRGRRARGERLDRDAHRARDAGADRARGLRAARGVRRAVRRDRRGRGQDERRGPADRAPGARARGRAAPADGGEPHRAAAGRGAVPRRAHHRRPAGPAGRARARRRRGGRRRRPGARGPAPDRGQERGGARCPASRPAPGAEITTLLVNGAVAARIDPAASSTRRSPSSSRTAGSPASTRCATRTSWIALPDHFRVRVPPSRLDRCSEPSRTSVSCAAHRRGCCGVPDGPSFRTLSEAWSTDSTPSVRRNRRKRPERNSSGATPSRPREDSCSWTRSAARRARGG